MGKRKTIGSCVASHPYFYAHASKQQLLCLFLDNPPKSFFPILKGDNKYQLEQRCKFPLKFACNALSGFFIFFSYNNFFNKNDALLQKIYLSLNIFTHQNPQFSSSVFPIFFIIDFLDYAVQELGVIEIVLTFIANIYDLV